MYGVRYSNLIEDVDISVYKTIIDKRHAEITCCVIITTEYAKLCRQVTKAATQWFYANVKEKASRDRFVVIKAVDYRKKEDCPDKIMFLKEDNILLY
ncbi:hypothetical protein PR048_028436 [Dryococelus australis]|uniref:Uncharacterized protein n=1 Tax=Dryococelus australis TaxID=614101 RepID=A0ABQ9GEF0_9NEOP|nr:hypothetical protein PR048_028436 [Dryococelus australis]